MKESTEAHRLLREEGYDDFYKGKRRHHCPHTEPFKAIQWFAGWEQAQTEWNTNQRGPANYKPVGTVADLASLDLPKGTVLYIKG